jgi:hypothetical protein
MQSLPTPRMILAGYIIFGLFFGCILSYRALDLLANYFAPPPRLLLSGEKKLSIGETEALLVVILSGLVGLA